VRNEQRTDSRVARFSRKFGYHAARVSSRSIFPEAARVKYYANTLEFPLEKFPSTASIDKQRRYPSACLASRSSGRKRKRGRFPLTVEEKITPRDIGSISEVIS